MITTRLRNLLAAVVCLFAGVNAQAQFSGSAEQYAETYWSLLPVSFSLDEVATALGTDGATLADEFNAWQDDAKEFDANLLWLVSPEDQTQIDGYTCDGKGFFMTKEGAVATWGNNGVWYTYCEANADAGTFSFQVAQSDALGEDVEALKVGDVAKANFVLKYNGKEATFAVTFNIIAKPVYDIPEPATIVEAELNIVGEAEVTVEQYPRGGYENDPVNVTIADLAEKLGIPDAGVLSVALEDLLYAVRYNDGDAENGGGMKQDTITTTLPDGIGTAPGWWFTDVEDAEGQKSGESAASFYGGSKFFMEAFKYDVETGVLSCNMGQMPNTLKAEEKYFANVYIVYGEKVFRVRYNLNILEKPQGQGLEGLTEVGSVSYEFEQSPAAYNWINFDVDLEAIAAALGCEPGNLDYAMLDDSDNWGSKTAENRGFWISEIGTVTNWGPNARICVLPVDGNDLSKLMVGQMEGTCEVGDVYNASLYFIYGENYYTLNIKFTILPPEYEVVNLDIKATRVGAMQTLPAPSGSWQEEFTAFSLDPADVAAIIGTDSPELYCESNPEYLEESGQQYVYYHTNNYHCDPTPGVWLSADGKAQGYDGENSPFGLCYDVATGAFQVFQMPAVNSVGDTYIANLYLVNNEVEDGDWPAVKVTITVSIVESLVAKENVGSESKTVIVKEGDAVTESIDLAKAAEALGVTAADLLSADNYYLRGLKNDGLYSEGVTCAEGLGFDQDGYCDAYGNTFITITETGMEVDFGYEFDEEGKYNADVQFCFEIDNKQYVYYVKLLSENSYEDGITTITTAADRNAQVYDLQGRPVSQPTHGLYIRNGRKVVIK